MTNKAVILDTNLFLLFLVGLTSQSYISRHKKLSEFVVEDFNELEKILGRSSEVLITPHTLTEISNLAAYIDDPAKSQIFSVFKTLVSELKEEFIPGRILTGRQEFIRLGLTDCAIIEQALVGGVVLTADLDLYIAVVTAGADAINFNHIRETYL